MVGNIQKRNTTSRSDQISIENLRCSISVTPPSTQIRCCFQSKMTQKWAGENTQFPRGDSGKDKNMDSTKRASKRHRISKQKQNPETKVFLLQRVARSVLESVLVVEPWGHMFYIVLLNVPIKKNLIKPNVSKTVKQ